MIATAPIVGLTPTENRIYQILRAADGRPVSYERLALEGLKQPFGAESASELKVYVARIRRKVGQPVECLRGFGYRLGNSRACPTCGHLAEGPRLDY